MTACSMVSVNIDVFFLSFPDFPKCHVTTYQSFCFDLQFISSRVNTSRKYEFFTGSGNNTNSTLSVYGFTQTPHESVPYP